LQTAFLSPHGTWQQLNFEVRRASKPSAASIHLGPMEQYYSILKECGMFRGILPQRYRDVLSCLNAHTASYSRGSCLVQYGAQDEKAGIVLDGMIEEFFYDENGNQVNICRLTKGQVFGSELAGAGWTSSPVCLQAGTDCNVLLLDLRALMSQRTMSCPCRLQVSANLMQSMAEQLLFFNTKVRILAQKRLRDRLKIYLQTLTPDTDGYYHLPYNRTELADFLCVDRSALSRELCRMRDEGVLIFSGSKMKLLSS
jgi:CRP/FNR family transcriptional regulator, dissimilatory nitrate respiration regulator